MRERALPPRAKKERVSHAQQVLPTAGASDPSLHELLAFERLLSDLSAGFANVTADQVVAEIETALKQLIRFLGFDRGTFGDLNDRVGLSVLCSASTEGMRCLPSRSP